jgi:hypothetical protein
VPTPETDPSLIYLAGAATFYNIPKATLSKSAKKRPGDLGYLWSGREGRRVWFRKTDMERLSKSRARLGGGADSGTGFERLATRLGNRDEDE